MRLQYLEPLKDVGGSPSTKIVIPKELGGLVSGILGQLPPQPSGPGENGHGELRTGPSARPRGAAGELGDSAQF